MFNFRHFAKGQNSCLQSSFAAQKAGCRLASVSSLQGQPRRSLSFLQPQRERLFGVWHSSSSKWIWLSAGFATLAAAEAIYIWEKRKKATPTRLYDLATDLESAAEGVSQSWKELKTSAAVQIGEETVALPPRCAPEYWKSVLFELVGASRLASVAPLRRLLEDSGGVDPVDISSFLCQLAAVKGRNLVVVEGIEGSGKTTALQLYVWNEVKRGRPALYVHCGQTLKAGAGPGTAFAEDELVGMAESATAEGKTATVVIDGVTRNTIGQLSSLLSNHRSLNLRIVLATSDFYLSEAVANKTAASVVRLEPPSAPELRRVLAALLAEHGKESALLDVYCDSVGSFRGLFASDFDNYTRRLFNQSVAMMQQRLGQVLQQSSASASNLRAALTELCSQHYIYPISPEQVNLCNALTKCEILRPGDPDRDWYEFRDPTVQVVVRALLGLPLPENQRSGRQLRSGVSETLWVLEQSKVGMDKVKERLEAFWAQPKKFISEKSTKKKKGKDDGKKSITKKSKSKKVKKEKTSAGKKEAFDIESPPPALSETMKPEEKLEEKKPRRKKRGEEVIGDDEDKGKKDKKDKKSKKDKKGKKDKRGEEGEDEMEDKDRKGKKGKKGKKDKKGKKGKKDEVKDAESDGKKKKEGKNKKREVDGEFDEGKADKEGEKGKKDKKEKKGKKGKKDKKGKKEKKEESEKSSLPAKQ